MSTYSLVGKLALITGASSGIGLSAARLFALNGCDLALSNISANVHDVASDIKKQHPKLNITSHVCDVTKSSQVNAMFEEIQERQTSHKAASIILNSAGVGHVTSVLQLSEQEFDEVVAINLKGTHLITQAAAKRLVALHKTHKFQDPKESLASIINLSSQAANKAGISPHYSSSKAGVLGYTRAIANELGYYKIRCNSILPYFIETPMIEGKMTEREEKAYKRINPLGRFGKPEEVANVCLFLASDASSYITGASIDVSGGV